MRLSNISAESRATWEALLLSVLTVFLRKISLENMCPDVKINFIMTGRDVLWSLFLLHKTKIPNGSHICSGGRAGMGETFWKNQLILPYNALRYLPLFKGRRYSYGTTNTVFWQLSLVAVAVNFLKAFVFLKSV